MPINIILDKSTFQLLSYDEVLRLTYYFKHNITPVLAMEILGDLKKEDQEGKPPAENRVIDFAKKLFPVSTIVNRHYLAPLQAELSLEMLVDMDGRPVVDLGKGVQTAGGEKGWVVAETAEEKAIYNWREGKFSEADRLLSAMWRDSTTQEDVLINLKKELRAKGEKLKIKDFQELDNFVTAMIDDPDKQQDLLIQLLKTNQIPAMTSFATVRAWHRSGRPLLKKFLPYAYHVLRVNTLFEVGLQCELIGTRPTNKVDLQYLYYLPFCNIFSSNDHLHKKLAPLLVRKDQLFVVGADLKQDLKVINEYLAALSEQERQGFRDRPPINNDSFTFQCYSRYLGYPEHWQWKLKTTERERQEGIRKMKEFEQANRGHGIAMKKGDDGTFVTRYSYMGKDDPCVCGSGKRLIDCCLNEEQFNEAVRAQGAQKKPDV